MAWLTAIAVIRTTAHHASGALGVIQLPPTVALVLALALLLEAAASGYGPAAGDNAAGTAAAIALVRALAAAPPRNLAVELVLQGAGDGEGLGLGSHLRTRRKKLNPRDTIVLGIAACGAGEPRWWQSDGRFVPIRYSRPLRALCAEIADTHPHTNATAHRARGATPALPARARRHPGDRDRRARPSRRPRPELTPADRHGRVDRRRPPYRRPSSSGSCSPTRSTRR